MEVRITRELVLTKAEERQLARLKTISEKIVELEEQRMAICAELIEAGFAGRDLEPYAGVNYTTVLRWAKRAKEGNGNGPV